MFQEHDCGTQTTTSFQIDNPYKMDKLTNKLNFPVFGDYLYYN